MSPRRVLSRGGASRLILALVACAGVTVGALALASAQRGTRAHSTFEATTVARAAAVAVDARAVREKTTAIMARQRSQILTAQGARIPAYRAGAAFRNPPGWTRPAMPELRGPDRRLLPERPGAHALSQWPTSPGPRPREELSAPQTIGVTFDGATGPTETGAFPPDTMGVVGPTQFFVFLNGRLRTFNKTTGAADGAINADPDVFFASVITPPAAGEVSFTSDPNVRYDRLSGRWFLTIIDVILNAGTGATTKANRILIAVSNAGSSTITGGTVWTFYQFQGDATLFTDYTSLGIDANALYIGGNMFTLAGAFNSTKGFVIPKAPLLTASPATVWAFPGLVATSVSAGPFAPRGVDNDDPANTGVSATGYFIGVDNATFNTLMIRRVTNPGSLGPAPTISANISLATPLTTRFPVLVPHLGNTGGAGGRLDSLDDRLYAAVMRNGRLWTAHNIGVNNTGVAGATNNRNAARWYELQNLGTTPAVVQSGTLFDNNATNDANQRNYWIPTLMVSGQGHVAMGTSIAGTNERVNAFTTGRLVGDTLGTMRDGPGGAALPGYTASSFAYNPPGDPGGPSRRWGDYSMTSLDPLDNMTMWTIQQYTNGTNTYGVRVAQLYAPPPATPATAVPNSVPNGVPSQNVTITGTVVSGSGFYDPGPNLSAPALPFNHIGGSVTGGVTVNSVTYNSPTSVTLNISTVGASAGAQNVTITNPDGQSKSGNGLITIGSPTSVRAASVAATPTRKGVVVRWRTTTEGGLAGFNVYRSTVRLNRSLIAASGSAAGHAYSRLDRTALRGRTYRIQGVLLDGRKVWLGSARS
jgi:hypothetical protein